MGRRSQHAPDELRELIIGAARSIVERSGYDALSAREIAREIGYAPGTLYNMFKNLDEILLRLEARILEELDSSIALAANGRTHTDALRELAAAYVEFAYRYPHLWQLVRRHHPQSIGTSPDWYLDRLYAPLGRIEAILAEEQGNGDIEDMGRHARLLWSAIHGVIDVATTGKFGALPVATTLSMVEDLTGRLVEAATPSPVRRRADLNRADSHARRGSRAG